MNSKIYRQADSRWGSLPYPTKRYSFAGNGCGCCAVLHCIIEQDKYKNYTPKDIRPYMVQYATKGNGTLWSGITKGLEHYGYNVHWRQSDSMSDIFKVLKNSLKRGVILFGSDRGPDGTCWTTGGHYIGFVNYKIDSNGRHWFYLKDSGGREHDGWWCYEKSMRGDVRNVWICTSLKDAPEKEEKKEEKKTTTEKVIDVSFNQTNVNWDKVKADGVKGVIVRCGFRGYGSGKLQEDSQFMNHIKGASKVGLKVGVYFFTEAINAKEGKEEAIYTLELIKKAGIKLSYPIAIDTENINATNPVPRANSSKLSKANRTKAIMGFCEYIKSQGYEPMIYASTSWFNNQLDMSQLPYKVWCAQYYKECQYKGKYIMWQYSSTGKVSGISGNVDMNHYYGELTPAPTPTPTPSNKLVVDGVFGEQSIKRAQKVFSTPVDGIISSQYTSVKQYIPGIDAGCVSYGTKGSALVRAIQKKVGASIDGLLGTKTIKKLQKFLGVTQDGIWGSATSKAFQKWLNKQ